MLTNYTSLINQYITQEAMAIGKLYTSQYYQTFGVISYFDGKAAQPKKSVPMLRG